MDVWVVRVIAIAIGLGALLSSAAAQDTAEFEIVVDITWSDETAPLEFPADAHISRLFGATHHSRYVMFRDGYTASSGMELVAENGRGSVLKSELMEAMRRARVGTMFEAPGLSRPPGRVTIRFKTSKEHFLVSFAAMVAPSPDWFTGTADVPLIVDGEWIDMADFVLWAWDAGTDSGNTYRAPDDETQPQQSVRLVSTPHFLSAKELVPVGTARLRRVSP